MKIRLILASILLFALAFACGSGAGNSRAQQLENQMMEEHDRIMPKMGELNQLYQEMRQYLFQDSVMTRETRERLSMVTANLSEAQDDMKNWMNGISDLELKKASMKPEELDAYLNTQKLEIERIGQLTDQSISAAKTALANRKK